MPKTGSHTYGSSLRRFRPRCHRPTVVSIVDIFVSSLVTAGFCRQHAPRGRALSTAPAYPSRDRSERWSNRSITHLSHLSPRKGSNCSRPLTRYFGGRCPRTQRTFSTKIVPRPDYISIDETSKEASSEGNEDETNTTNPDLQSEGHSEGEDAEQGANALSRVPFPNDGRGGVLVREAPKDESPDKQSPSVAEKDRFRYYGRKSPAMERHEAISQFYSSAIGTEMEWEEAMKAVAEDPSNKPIPASRPSRHDTSRDAVENPAVERFLTALFDETKSNQYVFRLYRELPSPGVSQLSKRSRGVLLRRFADPPNRRWVDARRYLALVEDMCTAGYPLSRSLWTSAIHLAGRAAGRVFKRDLKRAIGIWHQMEHVAGIKSDSVVFNTLFDISIKAGQYTVADRLMEEMRSRGIDFSRCGKVSKMYYHGFKQDVDGIRQTFDEFVSSGELVDTVVLNCLLVSFIKAGELKTAEQLYERMMDAQKKLQREFPYGNQHNIHHPGLTTEFTIYRKKRRKLGKLLELSASLKDRFPEQHRALQEALPMTPDTRTFHIFLSHHAYQTGNFYKFMVVLRDMERTFPIPPRGMVYLLLFEAFARHGKRNKRWSAERLQDTWKAYLRALFDSRMRLNDRFYLCRERLGWENPLAKSMETVETTQDDMYTPLPSEGAGSKEEPKREDEEEDDEDYEDDNDEDYDEDNAEDMLSGRSRSAELHNELEDLERRVENGVFLGRRVIISILRAFGVCCGPDAVMDVWLKLERIWQPKKRKVMDVAAVKEELEKQMSKKQA